MPAPIEATDIVALGQYARTNLLDLGPILRALGLCTTPETRQDVSGLVDMLDQLWELEHGGPAREGFLEEKPQGRSTEAYLEAVADHLRKDVRWHSERLAARLARSAEGTWRA